MERHEIVLKTKDFVVTEVDLNPKAPAEEIDSLIRAYKTTGQSVTELNQGGKRRVLVTQRTALTNAQSDVVRAALGWRDTPELDEPEYEEVDPSQAGLR